MLKAVTVEINTLMSQRAKTLLVSTSKCKPKTIALTQENKKTIAYMLLRQRSDINKTLHKLQ